MSLLEACDYANDIFDNGILAIEEYNEAYIFYEKVGAFSQIPLCISKDDSFEPFDIIEKYQKRRFKNKRDIEIPNKYKAV